MSTTKEHPCIPEIVHALCRDLFLKQDHELFLQRLGIVNSSTILVNHLLPYSLTHLPVNRDLYSNTDRHCCRHMLQGTLEAMIVEVDKENATWLISGACTGGIFLLLELPPFSDAEYVVVRNPVQGDDSTHNNNLFLPPFTDTETSNIRNPFLVVLDANIALRSFRSNPLPLRQEDMELIDLTVQLVEKIFFKPLVDALDKELLDLHNYHVAVALQGDEEGKAGASRLGRVVERPGSGPSHEEMTDISCPDKV